MSPLVPNSFHEASEFEGLDLRRGTLDRVELTDCLFVDCQLADATLEHCSFEDVTFRGCDLSLVKLGRSELRGVRFEECKVTGVDWSRAHNLTFEISFTDCVLDFSSFVGLRLKGLRVEGGKAHNVVFADNNLRDARLGHVDFAGTTFTGNDLRGADLSTCANVMLEPNTNRLHQTKLPVDASMRYLRAVGIVVPAIAVELGS